MPMHVRPLRSVTHHCRRVPINHSQQTLKRRRRAAPDLSLALSAIRRTSTRQPVFHLRTRFQRRCWLTRSLALTLFFLSRSLAGVSLVFFVVYCFFNNHFQSKWKDYLVLKLVEFYYCKFIQCCLQVHLNSPRFFCKLLFSLFFIQVKITTRIHRNKTTITFKDLVYSLLTNF